jgi:hypothetical protein
MKDRHLLFAIIALLFSISAAHAQFAGEYADKSYQGGNAVFQMSIEGSGNSTQVWFSAIKNSGAGAAPEGQGTGTITGKGTLEFKFQDSCKNSGSGTITRSGDGISVAIKLSHTADKECAAFYGSAIRLNRVK